MESQEKQTGQAPLFPDSVCFREDDPKPGFVYIIINLPGVKVQAKLTGKVKPANVEVVDEADVFQTKSLCLKLRVTQSDGTIANYEYKKSLVKAIEPKACCLKFEKNGQIKLRLKKEDTVISWSPFAQYLTCPDDPVE